MTVVMVVVVRVVFFRAALTGRLGPHSTAGLAVMAAALLMVANLEEVVGYDHPKLGAEGRFICRPVGEHGDKAGFWSTSRIGLSHIARLLPARGRVTI
jgi:hypothetical protein